MSKVKRVRRLSVPKAITLCRKAIALGDTSWQTHYQLGKLLSSCGAWEWNHNPNSPLAEKRLLEALGLLVIANKMIPRNSNVTVNRALVMAEQAMVRARLSRLQGQDSEHEIALVQRMYHDIANLVRPLANAGNREAAHAMSVLYAYSILPFFGSDLGYFGKPNYRELFRRAPLAEAWFAQESGDRSPDHETQYRWFKLQLAVAHGEDNDRMRSKESAKRALRSAIKFGDYEHATRALVILVFGLKGERLHRWLRYRKVRKI